MERDRADGPDGRRFRRWLTPAVVALILAATLRPSYAPGGPIQGACLICGSRGLADAIANVLLFVPLGLVLGLNRVRPIPAAGFAFVLSCAIEGLQLFIPGRFPVVGDLVFNTLGAGLGVLFVRWSPRLGEAATLSRRRLGVLASGLATALLLATGWLLQPSFPESVYYGQWTANLGHLEAYDGRVLEASIGGLPAPSHRLAESDAVRSRLLSGEPVRIVFRPGPRPPGLAPIFSVFDEHQREVVLYGLDDRDLVLRYRSRAVVLRLDQPDLRVRGGAPEVIGALESLHDGGSAPASTDDAQTVTMTVRLRDDGFCVWLDGRERACPVTHTVGRAWALLLYPESLARQVANGIDFVWVLLLTLPVGFWARRKRLTVALATPVVAVSLLAPWMFGQIRLSPWVTLAAAIGPLLGTLVASAVRRRTPAGTQ